MTITWSIVGQTAEVVKVFGTEAGQHRDGGCVSAVELAEGSLDACVDLVAVCVDVLSRTAASTMFFFERDMKRAARDTSSSVAASTLIGAGAMTFSPLWSHSETMYQVPELRCCPKVKPEPPCGRPAADSCWESCGLFADYQGCSQKPSTRPELPKHPRLSTSTGMNRAHVPTITTAVFEPQDLTPLILQEL